MRLPLRVDVQLPIHEIAKVMDAAVEGEVSGSLRGVALDTRTLQKGDLFFALKAARDGHEFVQTAFEQGACAVVVEQDVKEKGQVLKVRDTLEALSKLAAWFRSRWNGRVVAISGSNGKTTTKEMTASVLGTSVSTLKSPGTWNNQLGVPLALLKLESQYKACVLEMGMNAHGELRNLSEIAKPDVAILTNIGPAHLEKFGSIDEVAKAKGELFESLSENGVAIVNEDDSRIQKLSLKIPAKKIRISMKNEQAEVYGKIKHKRSDGCFDIQVKYGDQSIGLSTSFMGQHNIYNLLCALGAALAFEIPSAKLQSGINSVKKVEMRLQVIHLNNEIQVINDCYNANPSSMSAALDVSKGLAHSRCLAVLSDMMELGEYAPRAHRDLGIKVARLSYDHLFVMGQYSNDYIQGAIQGGLSEAKITRSLNHEGLATELLRTVQPGDTILVKGSRGMKMEKVTEKLRQELGESI